MSVSCRFSRLCRPLVLLGLAVCCVSPAPAGAVTLSKLYVALGDSVTQIGSTTGLRYPERFFSFLQQAGAADSLQNIGVSGETSASILGSQLSRALQLINDTSTNTTVVTLNIGGNDLLGNPACNPTFGAFSLAGCQPTLATFASNYRSLLDQVDAALASEPGSPKVVVLTAYNPWSGRVGQETTAANAQLVGLGSDGKIDCAGQGAALGLNDLISCIGAQHGAQVADIYPSFVGMGSQWFSDQIHPNDIGHAAIASVLAQVFGPVPHPTHTGLSCIPGSVVVGASSTCQATVTDIVGSGQTTPKGTVSFTSNTAGAFSGSPCVLSGSGPSATCSVSYTPTTLGSGRHILTATYDGETLHGVSAGTMSLTVKPAMPTSSAQCKSGGWRNYPQFKNEGDCVSYVVHHQVTITHVRVVGGPRNPKIIIDGEGFGLAPAPDPAGGTANLGKCGPIAGNTGNDYGTSLWINDHTQLWSAGYLPYVDCMGLVVKSYGDDRIAYRPGSFYRINYGHRNDFAYGIYKLATGDHVTVNVKGAQFSTRVRYGRRPSAWRVGRL